MKRYPVVNFVPADQGLYADGLAFKKPGAAEFSVGEIRGVFKPSPAHGYNHA